MEKIITQQNTFNLSKKANLKEAASNLYKVLRKIKKGYKKIFVVKIPNKGAGVAINDRLKKSFIFKMKLEVKNLSKKFKQFFAVNNLNFTIEKNSTLGLLGPNGCGKTTSIGMMLGLITPSNGQIFINDETFDSKNRIEFLKLMNFASPYIELPKSYQCLKTLRFMLDCME